MHEKEMLTFLSQWQGITVRNRHGCEAVVDGMTPCGRLVYLTWTKDPQADESHPSRVGCTGQATPGALGTTWVAVPKKSKTKRYLEAESERAAKRAEMSREELAETAALNVEELFGG